MGKHKTISFLWAMTLFGLRFGFCWYISFFSWWENRRIGMWGECRRLFYTWCLEKQRHEWQDWLGSNICSATYTFFKLCNLHVPQFLHLKNGDDENNNEYNNNNNITYLIGLLWGINEIYRIVPSTKVSSIYVLAIKQW